MLILVLLVILPICALSEEYTLAEGTYLIGQDIAPGTYELDINVLGICNLRNPDGSFNDDLYRFDYYTFESGYKLEIDWYPVTLKSVSITAEQAASAHYKNLQDIRLKADALSYEGVDALRYALPSGTYTVGTDIPAGSWQVRYFGMRDCTFTIVHGRERTTINIVSPKAAHYDPTRSIATAYFPLYEGDTVIVGESMGSLFLIPFSRALEDW